MKQGNKDKHKLFNFKHSLKEKGSTIKNGQKCRNWIPSNSDLSFILRKKNIFVSSEEGPLQRVLNPDFLEPLRRNVVAGETQLYILDHILFLFYILMLTLKDDHY